MLNRNEMKTARKVIARLSANDKAPMFALQGVIEDFMKGVHPSEAQATALLTVGQITSIEGWSTNAAVINELCAAVLGRMTQFMLLEEDIIPLQATAEQLIELTSLTDLQQLRIVKQIVGKEKFEEWTASMPQPGSAEF